MSFESIARGAAGIGLVVGGGLVASADTSPVEAGAKATFEVVGNRQYTELDQALGCVTVYQELERLAPGEQFIAPEDCPSDPANILPSAYESATGSTQVYEQTADGPVAAAPKVETVTEALESSQGDVAANRARSLGKNALKFAGISAIAGWGRSAGRFVRGRVSRTPAPQPTPQPRRRPSGSGTNPPSGGSGQRPRPRRQPSNGGRTNP